MINYSYQPPRKQQVSACGNYITMPDGSRFKRTVLPHPSLQSSATDNEAETLLDEVTNDDSNQ